MYHTGLCSVDFVSRTSHMCAVEWIRDKFMYQGFCVACVCVWVQDRFS